MKKIIAICILSIVCIGASRSQDCSKFYPFKEGVVSQLTMYNAKGKTQGMVEYHVNEVSNNGSATIATMITKLFDKDGNELKGTEYEATCEGGVVSIDFKSLMNSSMMQAYGEMDYEVRGTNLDLPNNLSIGQELKDAEIVITMNMSGMNLEMSTLITDRKVLDTEKVTTPAGTFSCYVLTQTTEVKSMGGLGGQKRSSKQWVAEGVGVVKTVDYNKKGKMQGSAILTSFKD